MDEAEGLDEDAKKATKRMAMLKTARSKRE